MNHNDFEIVELEERLEMAAASSADGMIEPMKCDNRCNSQPPKDTE